MTGANISVDNDTNVACDLIALRALAIRLFTELRLHPDTELAITVVDEERMTELHIEWMDEPGATDVLSFPMDELRSAPVGVDPEAGMLGDIVLCPAFAAEQAAQKGRTVDEELQFLITHGTLHLIGYDHSTTEEEAEMWALQDQLFDDWRAEASR
jgi:probable rRNA maturation factor